MGELTKQNEKVCIQLILFIPFIILILSVINILLFLDWVIIIIQAIAIFILGGLAVLNLIIISRVTIPNSWTNESTSEYFEDLETQDRVFVIPTKCPKCQTPIKLDRVWWNDEFTPLCQECQSEIKLRIVDR